MLPHCFHNDYNNNYNNFRSAAVTENCTSPKCYQVTDYDCFYKKQGVAACVKSCASDK